jgi:hypothetical protein
MKCIEENLQVWSHIAEFQKDYDQYVKNLKQIEKQMAVATNDPEPIVLNIRKSKEKLIAQLLPVIKVLSVFAYDKGMKKLEKKSKFDRENLEQMKQGELERQAFSIWSMIDKTLNDKKTKSMDVENYGLSEKMISSLHESVIMYSNLRANLKEEKKARKNAVEEIRKLTNENSKLLKYRIDKYIYLFEEPNPAFFTSYFEARKNKQSLKSPVSASADAKPNSDSISNETSTNEDKTTAKPTITKRKTSPKTATRTRKTANSKPGSKENSTGS